MGLPTRLNVIIYQVCKAAVVEVGELRWYWKVGLVASWHLWRIRY